MSTSATEDRITRARELGLPTPEDLGNEDKPSIATGLDSKRHSVEPLFADVGVIRAAFLHVLDEGWKCATNCDMKHQWHFDPYDESEDETWRRQRFADAVEKRIRELQSPPFNLGTKLDPLLPSSPTRSLKSQTS